MGVKFNKAGREWLVKRTVTMESAHESAHTDSNQLTLADAPEVPPSETESRWVNIWLLANRLFNDGTKPTPAGMKASLQITQAEWMQSVTFAKRERNDQYLDLYRLMDRKIPERKPKVEEEESEEIEIETEEITDQDALSAILGTLTGFDKETQQRLVSTAAVFLGLDFASYDGKHLVTSRPRQEEATGCQTTAAP